LLNLEPARTAQIRVTTGSLFVGVSCCRAHTLYLVYHIASRVVPNPSKHTASAYLGDHGLDPCSYKGSYGAACAWNQRQLILSPLPKYKHASACWWKPLQKRTCSKRVARHSNRSSSCSTHSTQRETVWLKMAPPRGVVSRGRLHSLAHWHQSRTAKQEERCEHRHFSPCVLVVYQTWEIRSWLTMRLQTVQQNASGKVTELRS